MGDRWGGNCWILAIDPGLSTGWALFHGATPFKQGVIPNGVRGFKEWWNSCERPSHDVLVIEDFIVEPSYVGIAWASEVKGAAIMATNAMVVIQKRSDKATLFGQKKKGQAGETERFNWLRERGFSGASHELDAITHVLVYLKRQKNRLALSKYWSLH